MRVIVLLSVRIHGYTINIVTAAECAHQDAHNQGAAVMIDQRKAIVTSPFVLGPWSGTG